MSAESAWAPYWSSQACFFADIHLATHNGRPDFSSSWVFVPSRALWRLQDISFRKGSILQVLSPRVDPNSYCLSPCSTYSCLRIFLFDFSIFAAGQEHSRLKPYSQPHIDFLIFVRTTRPSPEIIRQDLPQPPSLCLLFNDPCVTKPPPPPRLQRITPPRISCFRLQITWSHR